MGEHTFVTLASRHGAVVHGLNTNPNLSFTSLLKIPEGYKFKNNWKPKLTKERIESLSKKTVINLVQTDGLGLGAWSRPGRGEIQYSWEVTLPDLLLQPALLRMFYEQSTEHDQFVSALSGPGYMYPKASPSKAVLTQRLKYAASLMDHLDLRHHIIFD